MSLRSLSSLFNQLINMSVQASPNKANNGFDILPVINSSIEDALLALTKDRTPELLQRLASKELYDYKPLEGILRSFTRLVHERLAEQAADGK